jgi:hypothetical protein
VSTLSGLRLVKIDEPKQLVNFALSVVPEPTKVDLQLPQAHAPQQQPLVSVLVTQTLINI